MRCTAIAAVLLVAGAPALAQHDHAGHGVPDRLGTVAFANSCSPAAQPDVLRGVAMLHSFWYSAGEQAFRAALAKDRGCAIADWGIAALMMNNALAGIGATPGDAAKAQAALDHARTAGAPTQRERDYVEAVGAYYKDFASRTERERQISRAAAYKALAAKYPDDDEARIFSALYIAATQPQSDQTYAAYARATAILEPMFLKYPDHPGVAHYLIHAYDAPPLAARGLEAARAYSKIAPDAPHAQHMPSHIFTRVGAWEDSAASNARAFAAALPGHEFGESQHASDYMVYADLQLARDVAAKARAPHARDRPGDGDRTAAAARAHQLLCAKRDAGPLRRRAWRLAVRRRPPPPVRGTAPHGGARPLCPRRRCRTQRRRRGRCRGSGAARGVAGEADRRWQHVLGSRSRGAADVCIRLGCIRPWRDRGGARRHARRGRPRGPAGEAHHHSGPASPGAGVAGRHADGSRAASGGAGGIREIVSTRPQPLPRTVWRWPGCRSSG